MANERMLIIERILRDRAGIWPQIAEERSLKSLSARMLFTSVVSLAIYGAVIGASNSYQQAASSAVKLPMLFLATLAICLPTLYLFNLIFGARLSVMQTVTLILASITVIAVLTLAFAPISLFFLISAHNYPFIKLFNVAILVLTALVGLRFLTVGMSALNAHIERVAQQERQLLAAAAAAPVSPAVDQGGSGAGVAVMMLPVQQTYAPPVLPERRGGSMALLYIWILLFGFVGTQLAWTLRPFFGDPGRPFELYRNLDGTFYSDLFKTIGQLFGS